MEHNWPEPGEHLWGPWMHHSKKGRTFIQYHVCVHPECKATEQREVPNA